MDKKALHMYDQSGDVKKVEVSVSGIPGSSTIGITLQVDGELKKLTVNQSDGVAYGNYIDINNNPQFTTFLLQNKIGYFLPNIYDIKDNPFFMFDKDRLLELDPIGTKEYEDYISSKDIVDIFSSKKNIRDISFDEVTIFGKEAIMTCDEVDRVFLTADLYVYDMVSAAFTKDKKPHLENKVCSNRYATIITHERIDVPHNGYLVVEELDLSFSGIGGRSLTDFCKKHDVSMNDNDTYRKRKSR